MPIQFPNIQVDRSQATPLARQLYMQLHQQILHGHIAYKEQLPTTRALAAKLQLSRGVVIACYEMLKLDGLISGFGKGGTQVSYCIQTATPISVNTRATQLSLSTRGMTIANARHYSSTEDPSLPLPLTPSVPDFSLFPYTKWQQLGREALTSAPNWYQREGGILALKQNLKNYLAQYRGIHIDSLDCLLIPTGTQATLSMLARLLAEPGDYALLDNPCWPGSAAALRQANLTLIQAPVDEHGTQLSNWITNKKNAQPKIVMITPSCQFPTGYPMSMERREALIHYTAEKQAWLIEDDYAAEYMYSQHPAPSILAHSITDHVIHVGTMSKLLLPSLRLGWMVVPPHVAPLINNALHTLGIQPPYMIQQQLGDFIQYGYLSSHLANTRAIYNERRRLCSDYLQQHGQDYFTIMPSTSGMNHYLKINSDHIDIRIFEEQLRNNGFGCDIYTQSHGRKKQYYLLLGHANLQEPVIPKTLDNFLTTCQACCS